MNMHSFEPLEENMKEYCGCIVFGNWEKVSLSPGGSADHSLLKSIPDIFGTPLALQMVNKETSTMFYSCFAIQRSHTSFSSGI